MKTMTRTDQSTASTSDHPVTLLVAFELGDRTREVEEGHLMIDHVHLMLSIPPKYSVADVIGYIKGKSAIHIARNFAGRPRNFVGQHFWARGYFVSTVGRDEQAIRAYIQDQEREDRRLEQLRLKPE